MACVLSCCLEDNNFTIDPLKCKWGAQGADWLGCWLTPQGLKPCKKKIEPVLSIQAPANVKEANLFIGAVTFYHDMFAHRSHILTPLTKLTKKPKAKFLWTPEAQKGFDTMKAIIAKDVRVRCPDHNEEFHAVTNASNCHLPSVCASSIQHSAIAPPWKKNCCSLSKLKKSFAQCHADAKHFTHTPTIMISLTTVGNRRISMTLG
jgi:hypothetical protein